jgi:Serine protease inhibitor
MKRKYAGIILALLIVACIVTFPLIGCKQTATKENKASDQSAANVDKNLINSNSDFALKIFKELSNEDKNKNVFISPISISLAIAMAYNGARGQTQQEIAKTLGFENNTTDKLNSAFKVLLSSMGNIDQTVELYTGNSIWTRNDFSIEKNFTDLTKNYYNASIYSADFDNPDTAGKMNSWVSDATKGKISNIVNPEALKDVVMFLINAIYFKGQWKDKFNAENTKEDDFFLIDKSVKKVQMMSNNKKYNYYEGNNFQMLRMPYGSDKTAMYILLPKKDINIDDFLNSLSRDLLSKYISEAQNTEVMLKFPKFNIAYGTKSLVEPLKNLGMVTPFIKDQADFSGIAPQMFISQIDHKAIIEVNEEGTVAAAVTKIGMGATAIRPVEFTVNRPFILFIIDDRTGNILFTGKILEP